MSTLKAAGAMGIATFFSRILGLVREQVFAVLFGAGAAVDAFNIAFRIPNLLRDLFAEGAMSASFVPTFLRVRNEEGERRGWQVSQRVFATLFVSVSLISLVGMLFAEPLVKVYAGAFQAVPGKFELTVSMTRILFLFFPLVALAAAFMGVLNSLGKFFLPAFSSALFNLASVTVGVALAWAAPRWGMEPIVGMAIGVVFGGFVQAFSQWPSLRSLGFTWASTQPSDPVWFQDPALRRMLTLMIPGTLGLAATQINILVNSMLATGQGTGAVSWLNYAFRLMQFPIGVFGVSLAAASLPAVSKRWIARDLPGVSAELVSALRSVLAINLPAAAGLGFLAVPIIELIFGYGRFQPSDVLATAQALQAYAVGLGAYSAVKVMVPMFYAFGDTRIPVVSSALSVGANLAVSWVLVRHFGFWGLALGTSLTAVLNALFLWVAASIRLKKEGGELSHADMLQAVGVHSALALAMGGGVWAASKFAYPLWIKQCETFGFYHGIWIVVSRTLGVSALVVWGVIVVYVLARLLGVKETLEVFGLFQRRLSRKRRASS